jgi:lipoyl(octanoyl) transferase
VERLTCRLLPDAVADGPHNMAADEILLESAAAGAASLRFYCWSQATLSLGYFQPERLRRKDPLLAPLPYVRRPSGGATLVHHHELTYALALPAGSPWQVINEPPASWLGRVHAVIAAALKSLGVDARPRPATGDQPFPGYLCFHHLTPGDLVIRTDKVVGSAQRRHRGALLQHGAILLAASPHTPALPGVRELTGKELAPTEVGEAVRRELIRQAGWELMSGDWTRAERRRVGELVEQKYTQAGWNARR